MRGFIVEGTIVDAGKMSDAIMKEHMTYTQKAMEEGMILMSDLKKDMSGGIFIMRAESEDIIDDYLRREPFGSVGIQTYQVKEFDAHYINEDLTRWQRE